jgi:peroxiredoxin Q/BCP
MPGVGDPAPDFSVKDQNGNTVSLSDFKGKSSIVLMFYPGDSTPGCTKQMCAARDDYDRYQEANIAVFGVNPGSEESHKRFVEKHSLRTPLLLDDGGKLSRAYDALYPIPLLNVVNRTVVGIDKDGVIRFFKRGMPGADVIIPAMTSAAATA